MSTIPRIGQTVLIPTCSDHTKASIPLDKIDAVYEDVKHHADKTVFKVRVMSGDVVDVYMTDKGWRAI